MDWADFEDERQFFVAKYKHTALVAVVYQPDGHDALFGPFANGEEAMDWFKTVPMGVRIHLVPLRRPNKKRTKDDFYLPERMLAEDEFVETVQHPSA